MCGVKQYRDNASVLYFLQWLDNNYSTVQSQMLLLHLLPFATNGFSKVVQQQCQLKIGILHETLALATQTQPLSKFIGRGRSNDKK